MQHPHPEVPLSALERVHACLCEAGYPDARISDQGSDPDGRPLIGVIHGDCPKAVLYQAYLITGVIRRCWPHWSEGIMFHGAPACDPAVCDTWKPPRELLLVN